MESGGLQTTLATAGADHVVAASNHPWRRYWAKLVDLTIVALPIFFVIIFSLYLLAPGAARILATAVENQLISGIVVLAIWSVAETVLLSTIGTTPARAMFGIRVRRKDGAKLGAADAFLRSAFLSVAGLGLGIPIVAVATQFFSYRRLDRKGSTLWDDAVESVVEHAEWGAVRRAICIVFTGACVAVLVLVNIVG